MTQREGNMDVAINYYRQKTDILLNSLAKKFENDLASNISGMESFTESFNKKLEEISANMSDLEAFYNKKIKGSVLQNRIAEYEKENGAISEGLKNGFEVASFLRALQGKQSSVELTGGLPETIDLSAQSKVLETMSQKGYKSAAAAGGARARLIGEITEQVITEMVKSNLNNLFSYIEQSGTVQTRNFSGLSQGKSDMLLASVDLDFRDLDTKETVGVINNQEIELDLVEALDLEDKKNANAILERYLTGERGSIGGMTIKQWSDKVLGTKNATFAHSSYTMGLINSRYPDGEIAQGFSSKNVFREYTAYVISKFLINVIGVYNILVGNSTGIETTADWLEKLKNQHYMLEHVIEFKNGLYEAKDTVQVGKAPK